MVPREEIMKYTNYTLSNTELNKFNNFLEEHSKCNENEPAALSTLYNVKLIYNMGGDSIVVTCLCTICGEEDLISFPEEI